MGRVWEPWLFCIFKRDNVPNFFRGFLVKIEFQWLLEWTLKGELIKAQEEFCVRPITPISA